MSRSDGLYYTGMREGELLALTPSDIDFDKGTLIINKSYQRLNGKDIVSSPKTPKSNRVVTIPEILKTTLRSYMDKCYGLQSDDRLFPYTKSYLYHEMEYGIKQSGVKRIRVHDIRHPYVKHTTKKYNSEKQKTQATKIVDLIAWGFCFCFVCYSKRSWTL